MSISAGDHLKVPLRGPGQSTWSQRIC